MTISNNQQSTVVVVLVALLSTLLLIQVGNCAARADHNTGANINCDIKSNQKIDRLMAKLMIFNEKYGRNYPENLSQLKSYCNETEQIHNNIEAYKNRCFNGQLKQFSSLFIYSSKKNVKRWCGKGKKPKLNEFFKLSKCFNKNKRAYNRCMYNLIDALVGIKYAPDSKKVPHICCSTYEMLQCFNREMSKGDCLSQVDIMDQIIRGMFENGMGSTCGEYNDDSDKCQSLGKPPPKKSHEKVPDTVLYPFFDIINSLP